MPDSLKEGLTGNVGVCRDIFYSARLVLSMRKLRQSLLIASGNLQFDFVPFHLRFSLYIWGMNVLGQNINLRNVRLKGLLGLNLLSCL